MTDSQHILLVDDSELILDLIEEQVSSLLSQVDFQRASNGEEALALCTKNRFDLILTDIVMPKLDGLELIESIRKQAQGLLLTAADCPVLIVSSYVDRNVYDFAKVHEPCLILRKPFSIQHLADQLKALLGEIDAETSKKLG